MVGGGGLFGDLPTLQATKAKAKATESNSLPSKTLPNDSPFVLTGTRASSSSLFQPSTSSNIHKSTNASHPKGASVSSSISSVSVSSSVSLVGSLGNVGTTMAFMPASLRKRHRAGTATPATSLPSSTSVSKKKKVVVVMEPSPSSQETPSMTTKSPLTSPPTSPTNNHNHNINHNDTNNNTSTPTLSESEEIRLLHASVTEQNRYDPLFPNDLLAHREKKKRQRQKEQLEESARETLRLQRLLQKSIDLERQTIEATGDYHKIVEHRRLTAVTSGRGRGRGVSNLPAWLLKKQKEDAITTTTPVNPPVTTTTTPVTANPPVTTTTTTSTPSTMVVLSNMIAPGEIDHELQQEVKEECEMQFGPVQSVTIQDADSHHDSVRVFVRFQNRTHAQLASNLFHGRKFGDRTISAKLVTLEE